MLYNIPGAHLVLWPSSVGVSFVSSGAKQIVWLAFEAHGSSELRKQLHMTRDVVCIKRLVHTLKALHEGAVLWREFATAFQCLE